MSGIERVPTGGFPADIGPWFTRTWRKLRLSVQDHDLVKDTTRLGVGFGIQVTAEYSGGEGQTDIMLDFEGLDRLGFDRFRPIGSQNTNPARYNHSWAATRVVFIEACKEELFFGLPTGTLEAAVASDREPNLHLFKASDAKEEPRRASAIIHIPPDRHYERARTETAEDLVLAALYGRPVSCMSFEECGKETSIPDELLPAVLRRLEEQGALTQEGGKWRLKPPGEERAKNLKPPDSSGGRIGFGP